MQFFLPRVAKPVGAISSSQSVNMSIELVIKVLSSVTSLKMSIILVYMVVPVFWDLLSVVQYFLT